MLTYSPALILSWQSGVSEAISAHGQFVESPHVLIGLLRALDLLEPDSVTVHREDGTIRFVKNRI